MTQPERDTPRRSWCRRLMLLSMAITWTIAAGCGDSPIAPGSALAVTTISPSVVSTVSATTITITGTGFGPDTRVTIGDAPVASLTVFSSTSLNGVAPLHVAGPAAVVATSGGKSATFSGTFTYVAPSGANSPPVISSIRTTGPRVNQPAQFADINDNIQVAATVTDAETPPNQLTYLWSATAGSITRGTANATWTAPATLSASPTTVVLSLSVRETFTENGVVHNQSTTSSAAIFVHDSTKEILDMGEDFLRLFSLQVPFDQVLHNFSADCPGYDSEKHDILHNQDTFTQLPTWVITRLPPVVINFGGACSFSGRDPLRADACSYLHAHWDAKHDRDPTDPDYGLTDHTNGIDQVTAVLVDNQWRLCDSSFVGDPGNPPLVAGHHSIMIIRGPKDGIIKK